MTRADLKYLEEFLDEIETIYNYDYDGVLPSRIEDDIANIRVILQEEYERIHSPNTDQNLRQE